jgi:hypothetical protein
LVSDKIGAEAVPRIGALGGAVVYVVFMDHFRRVVKGHITIRHLQRRYGARAVQRRYVALARRPGSAIR